MSWADLQSVRRHLPRIFIYGGSGQAHSFPRFPLSQAVTVGVHGEEKKKRLHVLTALVLLLHFWLSSCKTGRRVHRQFQPGGQAAAPRIDLELNAESIAALSSLPDFLLPTLPL